MSEGVRLGQLLIQEELLTQAQLDLALVEQAEHENTPLGRILIDLGFLSETDLVRTLARQVGLDFVDLAEMTIDPAVALLIPEQLARRYQAIPVGWDGYRLVVAMSDPSNVFAIDDIRAISGAEVKAVAATAGQLADAVDRFFRVDSEVDMVAAAAAEGFGSDDLSEIREVAEDAPIVKFVNLLILQAVGERASDIHVDPAERDLRIRFRIDGVLHEKMRSPKSIQNGVISRLKIMAELDISERRIPQDGRMSLTVHGKQVDLRVATLPTVFGEKVVMRILDTGNALLQLEDLGFDPANYTRFEKSFTKPYGTILVTGPTGSGKSTTLYATLNIINEPSRNIITVEDPVEYRLPGISQVQINNKAKLTFAAALRSILRSDPDVILVGEIRDRETATIAIEAALTGHLVLSTLHTNDAASTPQRLVEMGVEPFLVVSALDCILAQRLARRLCERCKEAYEPTEAELIEAQWPMDDIDDGNFPTIYRHKGCEACSRTGYRGRFGVHELLVMSEEIKRMVIEHRSVEDIRKMAISQGMLPLRQDGLRKVAHGWTSLEEVFRVVV